MLGALCVHFSNKQASSFEFSNSEGEIKMGYQFYFCIIKRFIRIGFKVNRVKIGSLMKMLVL